MGGFKSLVTDIMDDTGMDVDSVLRQRGLRYGEYRDVSAISQQLKQVLRQGYTFDMQEHFMTESLDLISNKLSRIVNGDPYYIDSWRDIAGYAQLVVNELEKAK